MKTIKAWAIATENGKRLIGPPFIYVTRRDCGFMLTKYERWVRVEIREVPRKVTR